jgi:hypothetical protein
MRLFSVVVLAAAVLVSGCAAPRLKEIGRVENNAISPAGTLHIYTHTVQQSGDGRAAAWVVINLDRPTEGNEESIAGLGVAVCGEGTLSVGYRKSFAGRDGNGGHKSFNRLEPPVVLTPDETVKAAAMEICGLADSASHRKPEASAVKRKGSAVNWGTTLEGARMGGQAGILCGPAFFICSPIGAVLGGVVGAIVGSD